MNTFLFAWNPKKWEWHDLEDAIKQIDNVGIYTIDWSLVSHTKVQIGDRAFLIKLGMAPKGIMGAGFVVSDPYLSTHWRKKDKLIYRSMIEFDTLLHPDKEDLLGMDVLNTGDLESQNWSTQASGITIQPHLVADLEALWFDFLNSSGHHERRKKKVPDKKIFIEGSANKTTATRYERNPHARTACLDHYGYRCVICNFDFQGFYGEKGGKIIHVHHLEDVAGRGGQYQIDPIADMRPVCPNCHAVIHSRRPHYAIEEVQQFIKQSRSDA